MTEKTKTPKAAGLQRKTRKGKIDKAHTITGIERSAFESAWLQIPAGVRKKCTAAELAQLVGLVRTENGQKTASKWRENGETVWNRANNAFQALQNRRRRELSRLPALPSVRDYVHSLQSALTALAVRLPWGRK